MDECFGVMTKRQSLYGTYNEHRYSTVLLCLSYSSLIYIGRDSGILVKREKTWNHVRSSSTGAKMQGYLSRNENAQITEFVISMGESIDPVKGKSECVCIEENENICII